MVSRGRGKIRCRAALTLTRTLASHALFGHARLNRNVLQLDFPGRCRRIYLRHGPRSLSSRCRAGARASLSIEHFVNTSTRFGARELGGFFYENIYYSDHRTTWWAPAGEKAAFQVNGVPPGSRSEVFSARTMSHNVAWTGLVYVDPHGGGD
jgi:hypothetical protein